MSRPRHPVFARLYDPVMEPAERLFLAEHRRYLTAGLEGTVLDLGAGTGAMVPYFGAGVSVVAIEPDPHMRSRAAQTAAECGLEVDFYDAAAEALPFPDDSVDAVVAALVLCTVDDVAAAIDEVARVVRPGGEFRFLEHVRGEGWPGPLFDAAAPVWHAVAGGCHLNRRTDERLRSDDRFSILDLRRIDADSRLPVPVIRGRLQRR